MTANYHEGAVYLYRHRNGLLEAEKKLSPGAGCHQALVCKEWLLVPCLIQDRVFLFNWNNGCAYKGELSFPAGSGPRHGIFSADGDSLWMVGERDNRLYCFHVSSDSILLENVLDILPPGTPDGSLSAAIRLSPDGRFLTVSTRGENCLTTWRVDGFL